MPQSPDPDLSLCCSTVGAFCTLTDFCLFLLSCLCPRQLTTFQIYDKCLNMSLCLFFHRRLWLTPRCWYFHPPLLFWVNRKHSLKEDPANILYLLSGDAHHSSSIWHFCPSWLKQRGVHYSADQNVGGKLLSLRKSQPRLPPYGWLAKLSGIEAPWYNRGTELGLECGAICTENS